MNGFLPLADISLAGAIGVAGFYMAVSPRLVRGNVRRLFRQKNPEEELPMPGALLSLRVIGATMAAVALCFLIYGGRSLV